MQKAVCFFCEDEVPIDDGVFRIHGSFRRMIFQACLGSLLSVEDLGIHVS